MATLGTATKVKGSAETRPGPAILAWTESAAMALSAAVILVMALGITANIIGRSLFGWSIPDIEVMIREAMIAATVLPLAYVSAAQAHIAVEVFTNLMPYRWGRALDFIGAAFGFVVALPIFWAGWQALQKTLADDGYFFGHLSLPEWPGRVLFAVGYGLFVCRLFTLALGATRLDHKE